MRGIRVDHEYHESEEDMGYVIRVIRPIRG